MDDEERSRHKESASVALKTIGSEAYSRSRFLKDFWEVRPFFDQVLSDASKAAVHDDATEILQILCETKVEYGDERRLVVDSNDYIENRRQGVQAVK